MLKSVRGIYRNKRIELLEAPDDVSEAEVIVTFLPGPVVPTEKRVLEHREEILRLAERSGARNVRFVPTLCIGGGKPHSEADFLVDLDAGRNLMDVGGLMADLSDLLGLDVYVLSENGLDARIRERVLEDAVPV